jgi:hypothetical protein
LYQNITISRFFISSLSMNILITLVELQNTPFTTPLNSFNYYVYPIGGNRNKIRNHEWALTLKQLHGI